MGWRKFERNLLIKYNDWTLPCADSARLIYAESTTFEGWNYTRLSVKSYQSSRWEILEIELFNGEGVYEE